MQTQSQTVVSPDPRSNWPGFVSGLSDDELQRLYKESRVKGSAYHIAHEGLRKEMIKREFLIPC